MGGLQCAYSNLDNFADRPNSSTGVGQLMARFRSKAWDHLHAKHDAARVEIRMGGHERPYPTFVEITPTNLTVCWGKSAVALVPEGQPEHKHASTERVGIRLGGTTVPILILLDYVDPLFVCTEVGLLGLVFKNLSQFSIEPALRAA